MPAKGFRYGNRYEFRGPVTVISALNPRCKPFECLVDTDDSPALAPYTWGLVGRTGYVRNLELGVFIHDFLMRPPLGMVVDHLHHNRLDNRRSELRVVTESVNQHNRSRLPRNVSFERHLGRWRVRFLVNWQAQNFGTYATVEEAESVAAEVRAKLLRGESVEGFHRPGALLHAGHPSRR